MVLSQADRSSIFASLTPVIGKKEAEALLSQFPVHDGEIPITRDYLRAELAILRGELTAEMHRQIRELIVWMVGIVFTAVGIAVAVSSAIR